jgi:hypothetical protein
MLFAMSQNTGRNRGNRWTLIGVAVKAVSALVQAEYQSINEIKIGPKAVSPMKEELHGPSRFQGLCKMHMGALERYKQGDVCLVQGPAAEEGYRAIALRRTASFRRA